MEDRPRGDLVIHNGPVITMNPEKGIVDSVAIKDGRIISVGSGSEVKRLIGSVTEVIDLDGRACTPGLVDTHDHFLAHGISSAFVVDIRYPKAKSIQEIVELLEEQINETPEGQWILARLYEK